ncbi:MAG: acetyl/propionyl-CoA carboxylase, epsilon subunit [Jatrophihabitans sp.]|jgi:hypothetical protein|nr:acetyl/propionyl-CoA carboxylase, epsilon subunit [Jatrophihabitans sp.]MDT4903058.1 hypothetical protein [Pseudonocardiales bacterium]MDT4931739.1 hypothetical protein [Pseudonocardiales bacterium]MDT4948085.1 hypothetical protein [Pseudonocardiales bacterium]
MTDQETRPPLRIVKGDPTPEELAALTALVAAASGGAKAAAPRERRGGWNDPSLQRRHPLIPGPNAWRAATW